MGTHQSLLLVELPPVIRLLLGPGYCPLVETDSTTVHNQDGSGESKKRTAQHSTAHFLRSHLKHWALKSTKWHDKLCKYVICHVDTKVMVPSLTSRLMILSRASVFSSVIFCRLATALSSSRRNCSSIRINSLLPSSLENLWWHNTQK